MARRSVLLAVAIVIALLGTAMIVLYVQGIDARATKDQDLVDVVVAADKIDAGTSVETAKGNELFTVAKIRRADVVEGAVTSTSQIKDLVALATVFPGEQIIASRFGSPGQVQSLPIPDDMMAVSVELTDWERVAGFVNPGAEVAVFVTGMRDSREPQPTDEGEGTTTSQLLIDRALVLGVGTTSVATKTTENADGEQVVEQAPSTILTLAVSQGQAERLTFAGYNKELAFALLTEKSSTKFGPGSTNKDVQPAGGQKR